MVRIMVSVDIERPVDEVWADVADISSHTDWMADATAIRFVGDQVAGVGTTFECDTRVGPLRTTDVMEITAWDEGARMGVRHRGLVTGEGVFELEPRPGGTTRFRWDEELTFPWWFAGPIGERVAGPLLRAIWRRNLTRLKTRIESGSVS